MGYRKLKEKNCFILTVNIVLVFMICIIVANFKTDPFMVYRFDDNRKYQISNEMKRYFNYGIAKYGSYSTVVAGSCMTMNFKEEDIRRGNLYGGCTKLNEGGATIPDICRMMQLAFDSDNHVSRVIFSIDAWTYDVSTYHENYPEYIYDNNHWNDVNYLLNKDVLFYPWMQRESAIAPDDFNHLYRWGSDIADIGKMQNYVEYYDSLFKDNGIPYQEEFYNKNDVETVLVKYLIPMVKNHADVQFEIIFPPYHMTYWRDLLWRGKFEQSIEAQKYILDELLNYDNVKVWYFCDANVINDNSYYYDTHHYTSKMNQYMGECMYSGKYEVTRYNFENTLERFRKNVEAY